MQDLFEQSGDMKDNLFEYLSDIFDPAKNAEIKPFGKGHNLYINGKQITWVIGSKKNAEKELKTELKKRGL